LLAVKYGETTFAKVFLALMLWKLFKSFPSSTVRIVKESHLSKPVIPEKQPYGRIKIKFSKVWLSPARGDPRTFAKF